MAVIFSCFFSDVAFIIVVTFTVLYIYCKHVYKHWKKRGIRYNDPTLCFGNLGNVFLQKETTADMFKRMYKKATGQKVFGMFIFHKPILMIRDLDVVRSVLAKDSHAFLNRFYVFPEKFDRLLAKSLVGTNGKRWRHLRIKLTPTFTSGKMKKMFHLIDGCSNQLLKYIDQQVSEGRPVVVKEAMSRYAMDAIASCAFGVNANAMEDPNCEFISIMRKPFEANDLQMLFGTLLICIPWLQSLVSARMFDNGSHAFIRRTFWEVAGHRKAEGIARKDFVDLLVQLREQGEVRSEDTKDSEEIKQDSKYVNTDQSNVDDYGDIRLDDDDIVAQAYIFIAAGFETSSSVMRYALFELALNPVVQDRLRREIEDVLEIHDGQVTYDALAEMSYLDMVVAESMRKYPAVYILDRQCTTDCKIEGTDITIEKGTVVVVPVESIHYDPDIYPDPEKFDPERFSVENKRNRSPFAYLPFGEGPRKCIGIRFGLLQVKIGLVHILKTFQVRPCKDTPKPPVEMKPFFDMLTPKKEIALTFTKLR